VTQKPHRAVAVDERERVCLLIGLVVLDRDHLQNRVLAGERDERVPPRRKPFAERDTPFRCDLARRRRKARRNLAGDAPGCVGQPHALPAGHRRRRSARSTERARTNSRSDSRLSHGRRSSPEK